MTDPSDGCGKKLRMVLLFAMPLLMGACIVLDVIWEKL